MDGVHAMLLALFPQTAAIPKVSQHADRTADAIAVDERTWAAALLVVAQRPDLTRPGLAPIWL
jgi:hypothetical protein